MFSYALLPGRGLKLIEQSSYKDTSEDKVKELCTRWTGHDYAEEI